MDRFHEIRNQVVAASKPGPRRQYGRIPNMGTDAALSKHSEFEQLRFARDVVSTIGRAVVQAAGCLGPSFCKAVAIIHSCSGNVIVTGIGKAGLIGQKISATLASTGTPSHFLHPAEAVHGDLGRIRRGDVAIVLSWSGETEEVVRLLPFFREMDVPIIAITSREESRLGRAAATVIALGSVGEAGHLQLAPTTTTAVMLAVGDAIALTLSYLRGFRPEDFARFHPGGSLGRKLGRVEDQMRPLSQCRLASERHTIRQIIVETRLPGRRTGAIMLLDDEGRLTGIFTDSDLAKLLESRRESVLDEPVSEYMTRSPITVLLGTPLREAVALLARKKISELPVVDKDNHPCGLLDITDVIGLFPEASSAIEAEFAADDECVRHPQRGNVSAQSIDRTRDLPPTIIPLDHAKRSGSNQTD
ncbi:KpsF/GutQ family sugar-phosphate isomerase [Thermogutta terrifontis]|uniref:KpsF/GutQ family sugar-phosphate isomerase n=1 Tax=Thermogutta terrifontis TaxID=1331910 RepID=UPI001A9A3256|nr:KpsF/GutQ family sugar-phosphate isomerase [Thermogutta terrifontis]